MFNDICKNNPNSWLAKRVCTKAAAGDASSAGLAAPTTAAAMDVSALCGEGTEYRDGKCLPSENKITEMAVAAADTSVTLLPVINFGSIRDSTNCRKVVGECDADENLIRQLNVGSYCCKRNAVIGALDNDRVVFVPSSIAHAINN